MVRPRKFDEKQALAQALDIFWRKGYEATSVQDLVNGTGLNRASLYNTFGDKRKLFLTAVRGFCGQITLNITEHFQRETSAKKAFKSYFERRIADLLGETQCKGCLMVNTAVERSSHDPEAAAIICNTYACIEREFARIVLRAQQRGEVPRRRTPRALARFLVNTLQGMMVAAKTRRNRKELREIARLALSMLE